MKKKSRAAYYRERRARDNYKIFTAEIDRDKLEKLEKTLDFIGMAKVEWLNQKITEEIGKE